MAVMEKRIFTTLADLRTYLVSKGFSINNNNEMRWGEANAGSTCYWKIIGGEINFKDSNGDNAFHYNLTDFTNNKPCGCVIIQLDEDGCALYLSKLADGVTINDLYACCKNGYSYNESLETFTDLGADLQNGLVICTPAEEDGYWRYIWRHWNPNDINWCIDDSYGIVTVGQEIPSVNLINVSSVCSLTRACLNRGGWSDYIYVQVVGEATPPGNVFKIQGQKFITFTESATARCPAFKLPPEEVRANISTSTEEFSNVKTYKVGDYCIYNGLLYKCIQEITNPGPFEEIDWTVTTVYNERVNG